MKKKILICEDDADIVELMQIAFSRRYEVAYSAAINDPVELALTHQPDLILMDLWIPSIGGEQAVALLKSDERTSTIPVIFVSANDKIREITERVNADGFIAKPFKIVDCLATIADKLKS